MAQKRRRSPSSRKTLNRHPIRRAQCRSQQHRDPDGAAINPTAPITRHPWLLAGKYPEDLTSREWPNKPNLRLPHVGLTRLLRIPDREAKPLTPPPTSPSRSEAALRRDNATFPIRKAKPQDDDTASQGSMTTRIGDRDREALPNDQQREDGFFDFDWSDEQADKPPIPWEQVQSYIDFRDNKEAHEYWQWDQKELKWRHVDEDTGEIVYCPSELD